MGTFAWVRALRWRAVPRRIVLGALRDFLSKRGVATMVVGEAASSSDCYVRAPSVDVLQMVEREKAHA